MNDRSQSRIEPMQFYRTDDGIEYTVQHGRIVDPGKFEGERPYVVHYWDTYLDGGADSDDGRVLTFKVTPEDRSMFPGMLKGRRSVSLIETDQGFVCEVWNNVA